MAAKKSGKPLSVRTPSETPGQKPKKEFPEALRKNLWKPGHSGHPGGRPKKLTGPLEEFLSRRVPHDKQRHQYIDLLIESMVKRAISRSDTLVKEIFDRVEGRITPAEETSGSRGNTIIIDIPRPPHLPINVSGNGHKPPEEE
jgi:Family of unknown function (DUF5681)